MFRIAVLVGCDVSVYIYRCMIIDNNGMVVLHREFIENPPEDLRRLAKEHIVTKVSKQKSPWG